MSKLSMGAALGQVVAGYRDKDTKRCAEGLVEAVERLREAEAQADEAERRLQAAKAALAEIGKLVAKGFAEDRPFTALEDIGGALADSQGDGTC